MAGKKATGTHRAVCLVCPDQGGITLDATMTEFSDGSYEWRCNRNPAHHGTGAWPKGSPAYRHAVNGN